MGKFKFLKLICFVLFLLSYNVFFCQSTDLIRNKNSYNVTKDKITSTTNKKNRINLYIKIDSLQSEIIKILESDKRSLDSIKNGIQLQYTILNKDIEALKNRSNSDNSQIDSLRREITGHKQDRDELNLIILKNSENLNIALKNGSILTESNGKLNGLIIELNKTIDSLRKIIDDMEKKRSFTVIKDVSSLKKHISNTSNDSIKISMSSGEAKKIFTSPTPPQFDYTKYFLWLGYGLLFLGLFHSTRYLLPLFHKKTTETVYCKIKEYDANNNKDFLIAWTLINYNSDNEYLQERMYEARLVKAKINVEKEKYFAIDIVEGYGTKCFKFRESNSNAEKRFIEKLVDINEISKPYNSI